MSEQQNDTQFNGLLNLDALIGGAITEQFNAEFQKVLENMLDPNTKAEKARKITLSIAIMPSERRDTAAFAVEAKSTLVPRKQISTTLLIGADEDGVIQARELTTQIPGQQKMDGTEVNPKVLPISGLRTGGDN